MQFKDLPYLVVSKIISYTPSWKIYQNNASVEIPLKPKIAAFTYDYQSNELPYALNEINGSQSCFLDNLTLFKGKDCHKANFLAKASQFDIVHLSLHASSSIKSKFDNRIYFAPNNTDTLFSFEVLTRNISPKLLILSACETAEGKTEAGEGTYSISRTFLQSGVRNIISSLWKIDDAATAQLLPIFYRQLAQNIKPTVALTQAKRQLLSGRSSVLMAHPKYWAGLILAD